MLHASMGNLPPDAYMHKSNMHLVMFILNIFFCIVAQSPCVQDNKENGITASLTTYHLAKAATGTSLYLQNKLMQVETHCPGSSRAQQGLPFLF